MEHRNAPFSAAPRPEVRATITRPEGSAAVDVAVDVAPLSLRTQQYRFLLDTSDAALERVDLTVFIPCDRAFSLTAERTLSQLHDAVVPPFPVGCFLVVVREGATWQVDLPRCPQMQFRPVSGGVEAVCVALDKRGAGLHFWGMEKLATHAGSLDLEVRIHAIPEVEDCVWVEPYPNGALAAICLTDHADWDSAEKMRLLADLFEPHGFRLTKTVFPASDPGDHPYGLGLDDPAYRRQIDRLHAQGTEIAYHSFSPSRRPPPIEACRARIDVMRAYDAVTWIDHSVGDYLLSRTGRLPGGEDLVALLSEAGVVNYWSYSDTWENPSTNLDIWAVRPPGDAYRDAMALASRKERKGPAQLAYLATIPVKNGCGPVQYKAVARNPLSPGAWSRLLAYRKALRRYHASPMALYDFGGQSVLTRSSTHWIFDTVLVNHLAIQLATESLEDLVRRNGLLLGHCYVGSMPSYGGSNVFVGTDDAPAIHPRFAEAVAEIGRRQRIGEIVALPFNALRASLDAFARTRLVHTDEGWSAEGGGLAFAGRRNPRFEGATLSRRGDVILATLPADQALQPEQNPS
ncbi:MAG: hypothetical protein R2834_03455 [Rhodothermales bacterium]